MIRTVTRRGLVGGAVVAPLAPIGSSRPALAQPAPFSSNWPRRTITILCPAAGGGAAGDGTPVSERPRFATRPTGDITPFR